MKLFGIVGWKNSGKTGLVERLVAEFTARGFAVSTVKHAHHTFDVDQEGRDSHRHRLAGARQVLLSSRTRWALMAENRDAPEAAFGDLLGKLDPVDLVLIEGFKGEDVDKIEAHREATGQPLIAANDPRVLAVASDAPNDLPLPRFDLNDTGRIADFIAAHLKLARSGSRDGSGERHALPPGVDWMPVDDLFTRMKAQIAPLDGREAVPLAQLAGRVLAQPVIARRASPPLANSAVDGYAFARNGMDDAAPTLALLDGRAEPGQAWRGTVPEGAALRVLTGAPLPAGTDTVALQENVTVEGAVVRLTKPPKHGTNTRAAGEDLKTGVAVLQAGHLVTPSDLGVLASAGCAEAQSYPRLRLGVLSTGNELAEAGDAPGDAAIFDANRPMLLAMAERWGFQPVDLGMAKDDRVAIRAALDEVADDVDAYLTSGGASAGDEDHIAALMHEAGSLQAWRVAVKPGRPFGFGHWRGKPLFALPGNPVAAFVCAAIFARPALLAQAGAGWQGHRGFEVPAAFSKSKKPGRREYLRARLDDEGRAEVFHTEGSGRVSGLSWADGLVELPDGPAEITPGTPVRYIPFSSLGL